MRREERLVKMRYSYFIVFIGSVFIFGCDNTVHTDETTIVKLWTEEDRQFVLSELDRTTEEVKREVEFLSEAQSKFRETNERWNITEITEHLEVQNELHFREIRAISKTPQLHQYIQIAEGMDSYYQGYSTDTLQGVAIWFLEPIGRFGSKEQALDAFLRARSYLTDFVRSTDIDLRRHFTFRRNLENMDLSEIQPGDVRDLHQLLLTGIAHTDRHLHQIRILKKHPDFPK